VVVTLPVGVLKAGRVKFDPVLPKEKLDAIDHRGMGLMNKAYLLFSEPFWDKNPEWLIFFPPKNAPHETFEAMNYYAKTNQPILLFFTDGSFAKELETKSDQEIIDRIMVTLKSAYGKDIPQPTAALITRWGLDPFAYGSYTYTSVKESPNDVEVLTAPLRNSVFFAGESTYPRESSVVQGAYFSGVKAAQNIVSIHAKASP
jgi:monoamine oxidase